MTETTRPGPQEVRVYPEGWSLDYLAIGDESDGTACVPFDDRDDAAETAAEAQQATGVRMELLHETVDGYQRWSYRPSARKQPEPAAVPDGQGVASATPDPQVVAWMRGI